MTRFTPRARSSTMMGFLSRAVVGITAVILSLGGCSLLAPRPGATQWTIDVSMSIPAAEGPPTLAALGVARPRSAAPWNSDTLVYQQANGEARADIYNGWVMPLDQLLQAQMVDVLSRAKVANSVTLAGLYGSDQLILVSNMRSFGAYFAADRSGVARVAMQALLMQRTVDEPRIVMEWFYEHGFPIEKDDAASVVKGLSDAYGQCLRDLVRDLRAVPADALVKP